MLVSLARHFRPTLQGKLGPMTLLEFWPDYGPGPLWTGSGEPADLHHIGLPEGLVEHLRTWNSRYAEDKIRSMDRATSTG